MSGHKVTWFSPDRPVENGTVFVKPETPPAPVEFVEPEDACEVCGESDDHYHCQFCLALCGSTGECADGCESDGGC